MISGLEKTVTAEHIVSWRTLSEVIRDNLPEFRPSEFMREIAHFYWETDIPTKEIIAAYGLENTSELRAAAGPAVLSGVTCCHCGGVIVVRSRAEVKARSERLGAKSRYPCEWANPDVCADCRERMRREQARELDAQIAARETRERSLRRMPYREYLQTPEWQETRRAALKRAHFRCQVCAAGGVLNVHHRTYVRRGFEHNGDLIVLCAPCHHIFHDNGKLAEGGRANA